MSIVHSISPKLNSSPTKEIKLRRRTRVDLSKNDFPRGITGGSPTYLYIYRFGRVTNWYTSLSYTVKKESTKKIYLKSLL